MSPVEHGTSGRRRDCRCPAEATPSHRVESSSATRPTGPNHVWAFDFVLDRCANGQQLKCLTVIDEWTNEWLAIDVGRPYPLAARHRSVVASGERARGAGPPAHGQRSGVRFQGAAALDDRERIGTALMEPGKPWQNGVDESFNGRFRDECLTLEWFRFARKRGSSSRRGASTTTKYAHTRVLSYLTPNEFAARQTKNPSPRHATGQGAAVFGPPRPGPLHHPPT